MGEVSVLYALTHLTSLTFESSTVGTYIYTITQHNTTKHNASVFLMLIQTVPLISAFCHAG